MGKAQYVPIKWLNRRLNLDSYKVAGEGYMAVVSPNNSSHSHFLVTGGLIMCSAVLIVDRTSGVFLISHVNPNQYAQVEDVRNVVSKISSVFAAHGGKMQKSEAYILWGQSRDLNIRTEKFEMLVNALEGESPHTVSIDTEILDDPSSTGLIFDTEKFEILKFDDGFYSKRPTFAERPMQEIMSEMIPN